MSQIKVFILMLMVFCHIVDDYYLQGWLASAKQKSWWEKNSPDNMYRNDYIAALFMHSFSWSFMITLVPSIFCFVNGLQWSVIPIVINIIIHMVVDDLKANKKKINLIQDQVIHLIQILLTWLLMI